MSPAGSSRPPTARSLALDVALAVERDQSFADAELARALAESDLSQADRNLATSIVYGSLAWRLRLDALIDRFLDRPGQALAPAVREILRAGLYQLTFLDRIPAYAVVDSSVELSKQRVSRASGLVNAVLRRALREGVTLAAESDDATALAVRYSHPAWLVELWLRELGPERACSLMDANNRANPTVVRTIGSRDEAATILDEKGHRTRQARWAPDALVLDRALAAEEPKNEEASTTTRAAAAPDVVPQGEASQLVVLFVDPEPGQRILDACAAPGGKSAYLGSLVGASGTVLALDPAAGSAPRIRSLAKRCGLDNVEARETRVEALEPGEPFDAVLVDAPCSGLGTLRQHPEIRWRRQPADLERMAETQTSILEASARHVRPGGLLVYSTCTIARAENEGVVAAFLEAHRDFREDPRPVPPAFRPSHPDGESPLLVDELGRLRLYPDLHDTDGFFAARLRRGP